MNPRLILIALLALMPSLIYSQEITPKKNYIHTVDAGIGTGTLYETHAALNLCLTNGLGKYIANFIDYNLYFDKSEILNHEISFKLGPYFRFNKNSYLAFSSGISVFIDGRGSDWRYANGSHSYHESYFLTVPVQAKLNVDIARGLCLGFKGPYNQLINQNGGYMGPVL